VNTNKRMGNKLVTCNLPTNFTHSELEAAASLALGLSTKATRTEILRQSLDTRSKHNPHWQVRALVWDESFPTTEHTPPPLLETPPVGHGKRVVVVGSGPAGYFCALFLARAGFEVTILEQGPAVETRWADVVMFDTKGEFRENSNYVFGEGGAGTFSDGKLTSRTKGIDAERNFIFQTYIDAGAPPEIDYLAHPHIGSNRLRAMTPKLRNLFLNSGGKITFDCKVTSFDKIGDSIRKVFTSRGIFEAHYVVFACGHSSLSTYRMLIQNGVPFSPKPFAVGMRFEIPQVLVNLAQWKSESLPGVKAAEYFLTSQQHLPVYSFCMCPGGRVVPASTRLGNLVVNGVSDYERNGEFANSAIVAGVNLQELVKPTITAEECLDWREYIEQNAHAATQQKHPFAAPACRVSDFLSGKPSQNLTQGTYPFPLVSHTYEGLLHPLILSSLRLGMSDFCKKMKSFESGMLIGVETTTSAPIRLQRDTEGRAAGFENLFVAGEMSGYAGGIVSSAAHGVKTAQAICRLATHAQTPHNNFFTR
jgi:uncharacterized FAD-dependent dehydrogenase